MRKRSRPTKNKDDKYDIVPDDQLSRLSDDILVYIISTYLPLKDAARTSKVSKRWRYLWCQTVRLIFGDENRSMNKMKNRSLPLVERKNCINLVNRVIHKHKGSSIEEFKVHFHLDNKSKDAIDKWIVFAISKKVQTLELDLRNNVASPLNYVFPYEIFNERYWSSLKRNSFHVPVDPMTNLVEIKFLKALILKSVNLNDEGLSQILSNSPILEHVSVYGSAHLANPKINGKYCHALKNLEIVCCFRVESVEIHDSDIVSFSCVSPWPVTLRLNTLQKFEKISIGEFGYSWMENKLWPQISCCVDYLQVLQLDLSKPVLLQFPELPKLKELMIHVNVWNMDGAFMITSLVEACPNLKKFTIKLSWLTPNRIMRPWDGRQVAKHPHQHLEEVEIFGYSAQISDLEMAIYFINNCVALKKLVIDPRDTTIKRTTEDSMHDWEINAREFAVRELKPRKPDALDLKIL